MKLSILFIIVASVTSGCGERITSESELDSTAVTVESATSMISGLADDQSGDNYAFHQSKPWKQELLLPSAYAASCVRPIYSSCSSQARTQSYNSCNVGSTSLLMSGSISLNYSDSLCALSANGSSVTRSYDVTLTGIRGGNVSISSSNATDYKNLSYGGGGRLTKTGSGWNVDILGKHKSLRVAGVEIANVSIRTLSPIAVTGSLSRVSRTMTGGQIEVNYNRAAATAVIQPSNLQWSNSCCHPVSGSMSLNWSGSRTGTSAVTFQGCGQAEVNENGQVRNIELSYCE